MNYIYELYYMLEFLSAIPFLFSPVAVLIWLGFNIYRYVLAKKANERVPGTYSKQQLRTRLTLLIISLAIVTVFVLIVIGIGYLLTLPISFM